MLQFRWPLKYWWLSFGYQRPASVNFKFKCQPWMAFSNDIDTKILADWEKSHSFPKVWTLEVDYKYRFLLLWFTCLIYYLYILFDIKMHFRSSFYYYNYSSLYFGQRIEFNSNSMRQVSSSYIASHGWFILFWAKKVKLKRVSQYIIVYKYSNSSVVSNYLLYFFYQHNKIKNCFFVYSLVSIIFICMVVMLALLQVYDYINIEALPSVLNLMFFIMIENWICFPF